MAEKLKLGTGLLLTSLLSGLAGAMAWGIRGQYGHETGAMIAGVLVGFTLVTLLARHLTALDSARAVAMFALGVSVGGSMTYGQTVGLTHDSVFVGNTEAYYWGMLGLAIKGGIWISLGAAMFGMALSAKRYPWYELLCVFVVMIAAQWIGWKLLNQPFDKAEGIVPRIYFSHYDYWEAKQDKPRGECWGGLLFALTALLVYVGAVKRDRLALWLGLWGLVGGAIGFPAGQALQAYNAWHREWIMALSSYEWMKFLNWWNLMETTFGLVMGAFVGFGCWLHRHLIRGDEAVGVESKQAVPLPGLLELVLLCVHLRLLIAWNFQSIEWVDAFADRALPMIVIPTLCVMTGRYWPFLMSLPVVMIPIAGKTVRQLYFGEELVPSFESQAWFLKWFGEQPPGQTAWDLYLVFPLAVATITAIGFAMCSPANRRGLFAPVGLAVVAWLYFYLNNAFFHYPAWWHEEWTGRTIHGAIYLFCASCLTLASVVMAVAYLMTRNRADERDAFDSGNIGEIPSE